MDGLTFLDPRTQEDLVGSDETGVLTEGETEREGFLCEPVFTDEL